MRTKKELFKAFSKNETKKLIKFCNENKAFSKFKTLMKQYRSASRLCVYYKLYLSHVGWGIDSENNTDYNNNMVEFINAVSKTLK